jgi:hypothetical protein
VTDWTQKELEVLFVRKDLDATRRSDFERRISKLEATMEWGQRLIIGQGLVLIVALVLFVIERVSGA